MSLAGLVARDVGIEKADNEGTQAVTLPVDGGGRAVLVFRGDRQDTYPELVAVDLATGYPVAEFVGKSGSRLDLLDSSRDATPRARGLVLSDNTGSRSFGRQTERRA